jgi:hypothetical protein
MFAPRADGAQTRVRARFALEELALSDADTVPGFPEAAAIRVHRANEKPPLSERPPSCHSPDWAFYAANTLGYALAGYPLRDLPR